MLLPNIYTQPSSSNLYVYVPFLLASSGLMSKMSTPCIFPRISRRSRPVACSRSVGMVPGWAPSGRRSASEVISAAREWLAINISLSRRRAPYLSMTSCSISDSDGDPVVEESLAYGRKASCASKPHQAWGLRGCRCRLHRKERSQHCTLATTLPTLQIPSPPLSSPPILFLDSNGLPLLLHNLRKKESDNSHLLKLLAKLRTGTTGRAATARLATVETARRANMLVSKSGVGEGIWGVFRGQAAAAAAVCKLKLARSLALLRCAASPVGFDLARTSPALDFVLHEWLDVDWLESDKYVYSRKRKVEK
jgi:hypothetical protein